MLEELVHSDKKQAMRELFGVREIFLILIEVGVGEWETFTKTHQTVHI